MPAAGAVQLFGQVNHRRPSSSASRAPSAPSSSASRSPLASSSSASRARATSIEPAPTWTLAQEPIRVRNPRKVSLLSSDGPCPTRRRGVSLRLVRCLASRRSLFFQKLKHRARECASVLLCCSVAAYLHQRIDMLLWKLSRIILAWEAFPGRELTNFPNAGGARKGVQCCVLLFRRSVTNRVFAVCQMPEFHPWAIRKCYVSSLSWLRTLIQTRYFDVTNGLDLEVKGFVIGAQGAFAVVTPIFHDAICFLRISK
jgi:hypothetical protein